MGYPVSGEKFVADFSFFLRYELWEPGGETHRRSGWVKKQEQAPSLIERRGLL